MSQRQVKPLDPTKPWLCEVRVRADLVGNLWTVTSSVQLRGREGIIGWKTTRVAVTPDFQDQEDLKSWVDFLRPLMG